MGAGWEATHLVYALQLTSTQQRVPLAMAKHASHDNGDDFGEIRPSIELVALQLRYSVRHVRRIVRELREIGVLELTRSTGGQPNVYRLSFEKAPIRWDWGPSLGTYRSTLHEALEDIRPDIAPYEPDKPRNTDPDISTHKGGHPGVTRTTSEPHPHISNLRSPKIGGTREHLITGLPMRSMLRVGASPHHPNRGRPLVPTSQPDPTAEDCGPGHTDQGGQQCPTLISA